MAEWLTVAQLFTIFLDFIMHGLQEFRMTATYPYVIQHYDSISSFIVRYKRMKKILIGAMGSIDVSYFAFLGGHVVSATCSCVAARLVRTKLAFNLH